MKGLTVYDHVPECQVRDLTPSFDESPYTPRQFQKETFQHKNATKNFDYTRIPDRLWTASWGNDSH